MATVSLPADLAQLTKIREFVLQAGRELDLEEGALFELQLAVDEACTNVIKHAYGGRGGTIEVTVEPDEDGVRVIIRDWGRSFDVQSMPVPDVNLPLEQRELGGLGLFLMHQMVDDIHFEFDTEYGNSLTMVKR
jgi:serine/threonine-protein kinase RsbW